jgi:hypothetical protein
MQIRGSKGSLVSFLLIIFAFGLIIVFGLIAIELLVKWVTFGRVQTATQAAALAFAREVIKLRDNEMGTVASNTPNKYNLRFAQTRMARACNKENNYTGCTPADPQVLQEEQVRGSAPCINFVECVNAAQVLLYNLKSSGSIKDASQVKDLTYNQCYKDGAATQFARIGVPPNCSGGTGTVLSPLTELNWDFYSAAYGTGVCSRTPADGQNATMRNTDKDFCVEAEARGRMDPVIAGGLAFLTGKGVFSPAAMSANGRQAMNPVNFITRGDFAVRARAIVLRPDFEVDTNTALSREGKDEYYDDLKNYSADTVSLENCNTFGGTGCD